MLTLFKPYAEKILTPFVNQCQHINPNLITYLGLIFPLLFSLFLLTQQYSFALLSFLFLGIDMLDGMIARKYKKTSAFGGVLDSTVDRFADFVVIAAFGFAKLVPWEIIIPLLLVSYLISYIRSRSELAAKGQQSFAVGIIERTERLAVVFFSLFIFLFFPTTTFYGYNLISWIFLLLFILSCITVFQRMLYAMKKLAKMS